MNSVHVLLQMTVLLEKLTAGYALVWLLLEVDRFVVALHVILQGKDFAA